MTYVCSGFCYLTTIISCFMDAIGLLCFIHDCCNWKACSSGGSTPVSDCFLRLNRSCSCCPLCFTLGWKNLKHLFLNCTFSALQTAFVRCGFGFMQSLIYLLMSKLHLAFGTNFYDHRRLRVSRRNCENSESYCYYRKYLRCALILRPGFSEFSFGHNISVASALGMGISMLLVKSTLLMTAL